MVKISIWNVTMIHTLMIVLEQKPTRTRQEGIYRTAVVTQGI